MKTWFTVKNNAAAPGGTPTATISIHDEIGYWGVTAKDFIDAFRAIPEDAQITLSVHSPGGEVFDALAIYNVLKAASHRITARIEGLAASAASLIVMAAGKIVMPQNSYMMIHNPVTIAWGEVSDLREAADLLERFENTLVNIYVQRTGVDESEVRSMLAKETWMDGGEAVAKGFASELAEPIKMAACASPDALRAFKALPQALQSIGKPEAAPVPQSVGPVDAVQAMPAAQVIAACSKAGMLTLAEKLVSNNSTAEQVQAELQRAADIVALGDCAKQPELAQQLIAAHASVDVARICLDAMRTASDVAISGAHGAGAHAEDMQRTARQPDYEQIYASRREAAKSH